MYARKYSTMAVKLEINPLKNGVLKEHFKNTTETLGNVKHKY